MEVRRLLLFATIYIASINIYQTIIFFSAFVSADDCFYLNNLSPGLSHWTYDPSTNRNKTFVRSVKCSDGNLIHIYCSHPYRDDIQRSRQRWLRGVMIFLTKIRVSKECIKLLLCEQVCKDGLRGRVITSYPQVMPYDNEDDKEYIGACLTGETHSCYKASNLFRNYNERSCETDCAKDFPQCGIDMRRRFMSKVAVNVARPIHVLGMNLLKLEWIARDAFKSRGRFPILRRRVLNTLENLVDMKLMLRSNRVTGFRYSLYR